MSAAKKEGPDTVLPVLGITVDTVCMELRLPDDKLSKLKALVSVWRNKKSCSKGVLQFFGMSLQSYL